MSSTAASFWHKFFIAAGVPPQSASSYAASFSQNRITSEMLPDLNKDYLKDLGVKPLGDVIAILKHAQKIQNEKAQKKAFEKPKTLIKRPIALKQNSVDNTDKTQQKQVTIEEEMVVADENERNRRVSDFFQSFDQSPSGLTAADVDAEEVADISFSNQIGRVLDRFDTPTIIIPQGKNETKAYYSTPNPGSVFKRLGKRTHCEELITDHNAKESIFSRISQREITPESKRLSDIIIQSNKPGLDSIFSRIGQREITPESKSLSDIIIQSNKPVLEVRPKMTISAGVLSPNSVQPPSGNMSSNGIMSAYRAGSKSLAERLGKKVEDKNADSRLPINASAIAKFLK